MIVAGIDEAGYGPLLGPLVVGCCAFETAVSSQDPEPAEGPSIPCLWSALGRLISRNRLRSGKKIQVNDSKIVYAAAEGLRELERSVLAIASTCHGWTENLDELLGRTAPHAVPDLREHPWYPPTAGERFPLEQEGLPIRLFANALRLEMERTQTRCVHMAARVLPERQLNRLFNSTRNKGNTLFSITAIHLDHLLRTYGEQGLVIVCDRQGGREHYGSLLRQMFDHWALEVIKEVDGYSEYRLVRGPHGVRITFREKAEMQCMSVALASMLSKYLREALMRRFNAFWLGHLPHVAPTAGYYTDGSRFLQEIDAKRRELGIPDEQLIRSR